MLALFFILLMFAFFPTLIGQGDVFYEFIIGDRAGMTDNQRQIAVDRSEAVKASNDFLRPLRDELNLSQENVTMNCFGFVEIKIGESEYNSAVGLSIADSENRLRSSALKYEVEEPTWSDFSTVSQGDFTESISSLYVVKNNENDNADDNKQLENFHDLFIDFDGIYAVELEDNFEDGFISTFAMPVNSFIFTDEKIFMRFLNNAGEQEFTELNMIDSFESHVFLRRGNALILIPGKEYGGLGASNTCAETLANDDDYLAWDCFTDSPSSDNLLQNINEYGWTC